MAEGPVSSGSVLRTPGRRLPIRCRIVALVALLALAGLAQPALGQDLGGQLTLHPAPGEASAYAGESISFTVQVRSTRLLDTSVRFVALDPEPGWSYDFQPFNLTVPANGAANTTLVLNVPANATEGRTLAFRFEARDSATDEARAAGSVNLTILERPVEESTAAAAPPHIALVAATSEAQPGDAVIGTFTLQNTGAGYETLDASLAVTGPASWAPRLRAEDTFRRLHLGEAPTRVNVHATVPTNATPGTEQSFTITATAAGHVFTTPWVVRVIAPAASATPEDANASQPAAPTTPTSPTPTTAGTLSLSARLAEPNLTIEVGGEAVGILRLANTGDRTLHLHVTASVADSWPVRIEPADLELAPDQSAEVRFTIRAPSDVVAGGRGNGVLVVNSDEGIVRSVPFDLLTTFSSEPVDETPQDPARVPALVADGDGRLAVTGSTIVILTGVGMVGAGALALANRPMREKLIWAAVGLYTRLARPDILGHEERERLYKIIEQQPGIHFHALQRDLGWNTGTLTYHLRVLEKHAFIVDRRDGLFRRFYVQGAQPRKEAFTDGPTGLRADVLEAIRNQHGMSQSDLALLLGHNKQTVNYHVKALERTGLIRMEKRGRETFLYPADAPSATAPARAQA